MAGPGRQYYVKAFSGLRHGNTDMSTLITLGTGAAFAYSLAALAGFVHDVYFEAVVFILGLVLAGRAMESRARHQTAEAIRMLEGLQSGLMRNITESMAGRAAVMHLLPLSARESPKTTLLRGGYPEVVARPAAARLWFSSYLQTYLERDVRAVSAVQELAMFRRFLALVASRHGQVLNKSDLAAPLGMSVPGIGKWLDILEATAQVLIVPPYFENLGKRLIKSPKLYLADSGLACHLLGIDTAAELAKSPFLGALFEGFMASEIAKAQTNSGMRRELYYFRDQQGVEVDFVMPRRGGTMTLVECKAGRTVTPAMTAALRQLGAAMKKKHPRTPVDMVLVYQPPTAGASTRAVAPGVQALPWQEFVATL